MMREKKTGVETLAMKENPHLLDISGDAVHMVSNASKVLMRSFHLKVEGLCSDIYDIVNSSKQEKIFAEFQRLIRLDHIHTLQISSDAECVQQDT